jgi:O-antigen ligase
MQASSKSLPAMTAIPLDLAHSPATGSDRAIRSLLFFASFMLVWLTTAPFPNLSDPKLLDPIGDGNLLGQILVVLLTASLAAFVLLKRLRVVLEFLTPILVLTLLWFACSAALSPHPGLALRRLVLAAFTIFQAAVFLLLPQNRDHFSRLLAAGALIVLAICYAGIVFLPELSIHQASDLAEPELAGDWRGFFMHKNGAGAGMAVLIFVGIFVARTSSSILGTLILALAGVFLIFTESKSPIRLLPVVLLVSFLITWFRAPAAKLVAAISVPLMIGFLTIGSVSLHPIQQLVQGLLSDPSFTGRNEIWRFALDHIAERPIFGFGFQAFWGTSDLLSNWSYLESWGYRASDAHNGFLNIAVMTGIVGLVISMIWIFAQPLRDQIRTAPDRIDPALNLLFIQIWLFGLCLSGFESDIFGGGSMLWFMMIVSIIGLRYQATAQLVGEGR